MRRFFFGSLLAENQITPYGIGLVGILKELSERSTEYQCIVLENRPELFRIDSQEAA